MSLASDFKKIKSITISLTCNLHDKLCNRSYNSDLLRTVEFEGRPLCWFLCSRIIVKAGMFPFLKDVHVIFLELGVSFALRIANRSKLSSSLPCNDILALVFVTVFV
uniref:Uncharacterized protein n=1 Tax=Guillardia theta TaxID=55529 RepID=A0A6U5ZDB0_GUITH